MTLEQGEFELHGSIICGYFFHSEILDYYTIPGWLNPQDEANHAFRGLIINYT